MDHDWKRHAETLAALADEMRKAGDARAEKVAEAVDAMKELGSFWTGFSQYVGRAA